MSTDKGKPEQQQKKKSAAARGQEPSLRCPRCDSPNTKFCYYNNYSLSQPRHFCKTCRRYWTKGGALRSVPIGGGCRKSKKMKCSSKEMTGDAGGLRFFQGISPAMDFQSASQFGDILNNHLPISATPPPPPPSFSLDPNCAGTSVAFPFKAPNLTSFFQETGGSYRSLASSIESLSCINQDLHWRLQQQRLAAPNFIIPSIETTAAGTTASLQKSQPVLFHGLEISNTKQQQSDEARNPTEWFFDNSYATTPTNWSNIQSWNDFS